MCWLYCRRTGIPVVDVTTTGRKSGQRRTTHLIAIPYTDTLALIGTNFGQPSTPAWVLNLEADPHARIAYRGHLDTMSQCAITSDLLPTAQPEAWPDEQVVARVVALAETAWAESHGADAGRALAGALGRATVPAQERSATGKRLAAGLHGVIQPPAGHVHADPASRPVAAVEAALSDLQFVRAARSVALFP